MRNIVYFSDSDDPGITNVATKTRVLDQKLNDISSKGQKPTINAIAQGFQPSTRTVASHVNTRKYFISLFIHCLFLIK